MMKPAKNRMRNNVSEPLDRACAGRILPKRNMRSHLVIIVPMIAGPEGGPSSDMQQRYEG
jgi:hypothetical protein